MFYARHLPSSAYVSNTRIRSATPDSASSVQLLKQQLSHHYSKVFRHKHRCQATHGNPKTNADETSVSCKENIVYCRMLTFLHHSALQRALPYEQCAEKAARVVSCQLVSISNFTGSPKKEPFEPRKWASLVDVVTDAEDVAIAGVVVTCRSRFLLTAAQRDEGRHFTRIMAWSGGIERTTVDLTHLFCAVTVAIRLTIVVAVLAYLLQMEPSHCPSRQT